jgi:hypothetical protein
VQRIPKVRIDRFTQLDPGDVFVYLDDEANGEQLILPLGPTYPPGTGGPRLVMPEGFTVISYGKDYILRLPSATDAWSQRAPADDVVCIAVTSDETFFRGNCSPLGEFVTCFVRASDGRVLYQRMPSIMPSIMAYALKWEIAAKESGQFEQVLVKHP